MSTMLQRRSTDRHLVSLENLTPTMAKVDLKKFEDEKRREFGQILARCVELAGLTNKEAAVRFGIDQGQFSRWLSGMENPQVWRFHSDELLGPALIAAQAEVTEGATVETIIKLRRKVG